MVSVTTTSISSRERPRPRGTGASFRGYSSATTSPAATRHTTPSQQQQQQQQQPQRVATNKQPCPVKTRPLSGAADSNWEPSHTKTYKSCRLRVSDSEKVCTEQFSSIASKSLDSGLDVFGAVPFSTPQKQVSLHDLPYESYIH